MKLVILILVILVFALAYRCIFDEVRVHEDRVRVIEVLDSPPIRPERYSLMELSNLNAMLRKGLPEAEVYLTIEPNGNPILISIVKSGQDFPSSEPDTALEIYSQWVIQKE